MRSRLLLAGLSLLSAASPLSARTWNISPFGTGDAPTIQAGIDSASAGDTVLLEDGTYTGTGNRDLDFRGKAITVRSQSGDPEFCVIDVEWAWEGSCEVRGALFRTGEGSDTVLEGVKIMNITDGPIDVGNCIEGVGAAVVIENASPTLRRVTIEWSDGKGGLGAIVTAENGAPRFESCTFRDNTGAALALRNTTATLTGCVIEANTSISSAGAALVLSGGSPTVESTAIRRNVHNGTGLGWHSGGGVYVTSGSPSLDGCLIAENVTNGEGGGLYVASSAFVSLDRTTIAGNRAERGGGIFGDPIVGTMSKTILSANCADTDGPDAHLGSGSSLSVDCSALDPANVTGPGSLVLGGGIVTADPLFCEPRLCSDFPSVVGLYSLQLLSPARDVPGCGTLGALYDVCTVSVRSMSWGEIKGMYREER